MIRHKSIVNILTTAKLIPEEYAQKEFEIHWVKFVEKTLDLTVSFWPMNVNKSPYFIETLRRELIKNYTYEEIISGGWKIFTTIDIQLQHISENILKQQLQTLNTSASNKIEGAVVIMRIFTQSAVIGVRCAEAAIDFASIVYIDRIRTEFSYYLYPRIIGITGYIPLKFDL